MEWMTSMLIAFLASMPTVSPMSAKGDMNGIFYPRMPCFGEQDCSSGWRPAPNMGAALRGYDRGLGDPANRFGDPGWRQQIFRATIYNHKTGHFHINKGVEFNKNILCDKNSKTVVTSNWKEYADEMSRSSGVGTSLNIGNEISVSGAVPIGSAKLGIGTKIPPFIRRSNKKTSKNNNVEKFFEKERGAIAQVSSICIIQEIRVSYIEGTAPEFTDAFKKVLVWMFEEFKRKSMYNETKDAMMKSFLDAFGTHFSSQTKMGAKLQYSRRYTENERSDLDKKTAQKCTEIQGTKIFGIQTKQDESGCKDTDKSKENFRSNYVEAEVQLTWGSKPEGNPDEWAKQQFTPYPIMMQLVPIPSLFNEGNVKKIVPYAPFKADGGDGKMEEFIAWFIETYRNYCDLFDIDCEPRNACGISDNCKFEEQCFMEGGVPTCKPRTTTSFFGFYETRNLYYMWHHPTTGNLVTSPCYQQVHEYDLPNFYTQKTMCPPGSNPFMVARYKALDESFSYGRAWGGCIRNRYLCLSSLVVEPAGDFGGMFQMCYHANAANNLVNPFTLKQTCPTGFPKVKIGIAESYELEYPFTLEWHLCELFACWKYVGPGSSIGGFMESIQGDTQQYRVKVLPNNGNACPEGFQAQLYGEHSYGESNLTMATSFYCRKSITENGAIEDHKWLQGDRDTGCSKACTNAGLVNVQSGEWLMKYPEYVCKGTTSHTSYRTVTSYNEIGTNQAGSGSCVFTDSKIGWWGAHYQCYCAKPELLVDGDAKNAKKQIGWVDAKAGEKCPKLCTNAGYDAPVSVAEGIDKGDIYVCATNEENKGYMAGWQSGKQPNYDCNREDPLNRVYRLYYWGEGQKKGLGRCLCKKGVS